MPVKARLTRQDLKRIRLRSDRGEAHAPARRPGGGTAVLAEARGVHEVGPPLDQALYNCQCGCVFEATVSTSVGCPHCGTTQAW